jgi:hypothetical protein
MAAQWFYKDNEFNEIGPFSIQEIRKLYFDGEILGSILIKKDNGNWVNAETVFGKLEILNKKTAKENKKNNDGHIVINKKNKEMFLEEEEVFYKTKNFKIIIGSVGFAIGIVLLLIFCINLYVVKPKQAENLVNQGIEESKNGSSENAIELFSKSITVVKI